MSKKFIPDAILTEQEFIKKYEAEFGSNKNVQAYLKLRYKWIQGEKVDIEELIGLHQSIDSLNSN